MSWHLIKYVLTAAARDKIMMVLLLMIAIVTAVAIFMGAASVTERQAFALILGAGGLRFLASAGTVLFCAFYIRRAYEAKEVEFLLARPITRASFLFSHAIAFALISLAVVFAVTLPVLVLSNASLGAFVWGASLIVECTIMALVALFFSMTLSSAAGSALAALGFYALARMSGVLIGIASLPSGNWAFVILSNVMKLLSILIPRLDLMGQTSWLVYGVGGSAGVQFMPDASSYAYWLSAHIGLGGFILLQGIVFGLLLIAAAYYDFSRRRF